MTVTRALRSGVRLCHSHISLLWIEIAWRVSVFLLSFGFSLLGVFVLLDRPVAVSDFGMLEGGGPLGTLKVLLTFLPRNENLILQIALLVVAFSVLIWLLLASFFQGGILASLASKSDSEAGIQQHGLESTYQFFRDGMRFLPSFLLINLFILVFTFAGAASILLILRLFLRSIFSTPESSRSTWLLWFYLFGMALASVIVAVSQQFLEMFKLFLARYQCSRWNAWNRSAEFFFLNLRSMSGICSFIRILQFIFAIAAAMFLWQFGFLLGTRFLGLLLSVSLLVSLAYGVLRNYLRLIRSGSLLTLID